MDLNHKMATSNARGRIRTAMMMSVFVSAGLWGLVEWVGAETPPDARQVVTRGMVEAGLATGFWQGTTAVGNGPSANRSGVFVLPRAGMILSDPLGSGRWRGNVEVLVEPLFARFTQPFAAEAAGGSLVYWNGAAFGMVFAVLLGRKPLWWGVGYGLLIGTIFLMSPAVQALGVGFMGREMPTMPVTVTLAHLVFGASLGVLCQKWVREPGWLLAQVERSAVSCHCCRVPCGGKGVHHGRLARADHGHPDAAGRTALPVLRAREPGSGPAV